MAFDDQMMNWFFEMPTTVGMESMAKTTSVDPSTMTTRANGVAMRMPFLMVKKLWPSYSSETG